MQAEAPRAIGQDPLLGAAWVGPLAAASAAPEVSLPFALRLRAALLGAALAALALAAATLGGLAIATGPFHISLRSLV